MRTKILLTTLALILSLHITQAWAAPPSNNRPTPQQQVPKTSPVPPATQWFQPSYLIDWGASLAVAGGGLALLLIEPPNRSFSLNDPSIAQSRHDNTISTALAGGLSAGIPLAIIGLSQIWVQSGHDFHHAALGLFESLSLTFFATNLIKVTVGRLRPDFLERCQPNAQLTCTGDAESIREGRRSFPSGHTSTAFAGGMFLSLYLWGKLKPLGKNGAFWKVFLSISPLFGATMMGVSRIIDNRHHWEDVLVGALLGIGFSWLAYRLNFPAPWAKQSHRPTQRARLSLAPTFGPNRMGMALTGSF